jgi:hypothetical protein
MPGLPASSMGAGQCFAMPDVCLTPAPPGPPVPIPYPNMGMVPMAVNTSIKVKIVGMPAVIEMSEIPLSQGDEPGVAGGVISGQNMGKIAYKIGSSVVQIEGKGCAYLTCVTAHNGANANMPAGNQIVPSQAQVLVQP